MGFRGFRSWRLLRSRGRSGCSWARLAMACGFSIGGIARFSRWRRPRARLASSSPSCSTGSAIFGSATRMAISSASMAGSSPRSRWRSSWGAGLPPYARMRKGACMWRVNRGSRLETNRGSARSPATCIFPPPHPGTSPFCRIAEWRSEPSTASTGWRAPPPRRSPRWRFRPMRGGHRPPGHRAGPARKRSASPFRPGSGPHGRVGMGPAFPSPFLLS